MTPNLLSRVQRREFLKAAGAATVFSMTQRTFAEKGGRVSILLDAGDAVVSGAAVNRAAERLEKAFAGKGVKCAIVKSAQETNRSEFCIVVATEGSGFAKGFSKATVELKTAESVLLAPGHLEGIPATLVSGVDELGLVYGLLELAERVEFNAGPGAGLHLAEAIEEKPANEVRCVSRYFCSELEDKPWYYDKDFWRGYLDALVAARFNRFCLAYGLEYDFPRGVTDDYLHLPYPYLVDVPGYEGVRVMQLADPEGKALAVPVAVGKEERDKNFEMLRFISAETGARGMHFQLGIWTHAYEWTASPHAYHHIEGLTAETHAAYCRDALAIILKECPEIQGLTMRVHGESGIPEGSYPFWRTLFEAISGCGRKIEIDMHAKGVNTTMIDIAVATGMPVKLGAKYAAEHQSLGYNQADIRALEIPEPGHEGEGPFSLSSGSRSFTRYGYADFLEEGTRYKVVFRLWPGTQRHLLSADPEMAGAYGRTAHFCGSAGIDLMEPLTFKGREGSGHAGGRCAYADASLTPKYDWEKFEYYYRVWGRKLYNPEADIEISRRYLRSSFGLGATAVETALANASRLLPLVTSAHLCSASNHSYWPEINESMPIMLGGVRSPYSDTPEPRCFATVSPLDPQIFSTVVEYTQDLLAGKLNAKYSPVEVAQWLETMTAASNEALSVARTKARARTSPEFRRIEEDVLIMMGLGSYFAVKMRSAVLYELYEQTGNEQAGTLALAEYKKAREAWAKMAERAGKAYSADVSYGSVPGRRGSWSDRLAGIDKDLEAMQEKLKNPPAAIGSVKDAERAIRVALGAPRRPSVACEHTPPGSFQAGQPLSLTLTVARSGAGAGLESALLHYRHVDQGERWVTAEMELGGNVYTSAIPGNYSDSVYALQYYFELRAKAGEAWLYPAFNATFSNQPYYAVMRAKV